VQEREEREKKMGERAGKEQFRGERGRHIARKKKKYPAMGTPQFVQK
jgi:hypothetical protein